MTGAFARAWETLKERRRSVYAFNLHNRDRWVAAWAGRIPPASRVIDVGAGPGRYRPLFAHCDYRAHDFGMEPGTVGKYTDLDYRSDIALIPVEDGAFDVVLCTEVLEHVPDPAGALHELARILKAGGRLLLTAPLGSFLHQEPYHYYGGYTPHWYRRFLPEAGFDGIEIEPNEGFFSWFGQETGRFFEYIAPRRTRGLGAFRRAGLLLLWFAMLPDRFLLPPIGAWLDRLGLEKTATVGYHVAAIRKG